MPWDTLTYYTTGMVVYVLVPFWFIVVSGIRSASKVVVRRSIGRGMLLSTLLMWLLMLLHRTSVEVPYIMERTTDPMYDGVGGNAAILLMGWFIALVFELPHIALRLLVEFFYWRRKQPVVT